MGEMRPAGVESARQAWPASNRVVVGPFSTAPDPHGCADSPSLLAIEDSLIDAAPCFGARWLVIFTHVILPLVVPGLVSGGILIFVPVIGSFMEPRISVVHARRDDGHGDRG